MVSRRGPRLGFGTRRGVELRPGVVAGACGVRRAHVLVAEALLEAVSYGGQDGLRGGSLRHVSAGLGVAGCVNAASRAVDLEERGRVQKAPGGL